MSCDTVGSCAFLCLLGCECDYKDSPVVRTGAQSGSSRQLLPGLVISKPASADVFLSVLKTPGQRDRTVLLSNLYCQELNSHC